MLIIRSSDVASLLVGLPIDKDLVELVPHLGGSVSASPRAK